jgi:hypothetical protein
MKENQPSITIPDSDNEEQNPLGNFLAIKTSSPIGGLSG